MRIITALLSFAFASSALAADASPVRAWVEKQSAIRSVTADFTQTRALRALKSPVATPGKIWFVAPDRLRIEIGQPAKTIVVRKGASVLVIQPGKKKAERFTVDAQGMRQHPALALADLPFGDSYAEFQKKFEVKEESVNGDQASAVLLPRDAEARSMIEQLTLNYTPGGPLRSFEAVTRDGSRMRNEFSAVVHNAKIERAVFEYDLTGYEVTDGK